MSRSIVTFTADVVLDGDALLGINMTCQECGEIGYKNPQDLAVHALLHPTPTERVTISRPFMDELERQAECESER